jgi:hypothetical protein
LPLDGKYPLTVEARLLQENGRLPWSGVSRPGLEKWLELADDPEYLHGQDVQNILCVPRETDPDTWPEIEIHFHLRIMTRGVRREGSEFCARVKQVVVNPADEFRVAVPRAFGLEGGVVEPRVAGQEKTVFVEVGEIPEDTKRPVVSAQANSIPKVSGIARPNEVVCVLERLMPLDDCGEVISQLAEENTVRLAKSLGTAGEGELTTLPGLASDFPHGLEDRIVESGSQVVNDVPSDGTQMERYRRGIDDVYVKLAGIRVVRRLDNHAFTYHVQNWPEGYFELLAVLTRPPELHKGTFK